MEKKKYSRKEKYPSESKIHRKGDLNLSIKGVLQSSLIEFEIFFKDHRNLNRLINHYKKNHLLFFGDLYEILFRENEKLEKIIQNKNTKKKTPLKKSIEIMSALLDENLDLKRIPKTVKSILPEKFFSWGTRDKEDFLTAKIISLVFEKPIEIFGLKINPDSTYGPSNFKKTYVEQGKKALNDEFIKSTLSFSFLRKTLAEIKKTEPIKKDLVEFLLQILPA